MEKQRARNPEEKAFRKQSIVLALRELLLQSRHPLPSVNEIARAAGVSKGVIYLYFHSREEIFLSLHMQESLLFFEGMNRLLTSERYTFARAKEYVVNYFSKNELFMYLGLMAPTILESNVSENFAGEFKRTVAKELEQLAINWKRAETDLEPVATRNFILRFYYLALMLWQHHHPPEVIRSAFAGEKLWLVGGDLKKELSQSLQWLWDGMKNT